MNAAELYDRDFAEWAVRNAELLRSGRVAEADLDHIAEEIEDIARRERRAMQNRLGERAKFPGSLVTKQVVFTAPAASNASADPDDFAHAARYARSEGDLCAITERWLFPILA